MTKQQTDVPGLLIASCFRAEAFDLMFRVGWATETSLTSRKTMLNLLTKHFTHSINQPTLSIPISTCCPVILNYCIYAIAFFKKFLTEVFVSSILTFQKTQQCLFFLFKFLSGNYYIKNTLCTINLFRNKTIANLKLPTYHLSGYLLFFSWF